MKKLKQLQNNFTTPEQSKRLLELGVPKDSADCYFYDWDLRDCNIHSKGGAPQIFDWYERDIEKFKSRKCIKMYPCWSLGRLIEIMALCYKFDLPDSGSVQICATDIKKRNVVDVLISDIERFINKIDFSKLKE